MSGGSGKRSSKEVAVSGISGEKVNDAGLSNLGLHDRAFSGTFLFTLLILYLEREALRWVQRYIGNFGGDPTKVTMYV